MSLYLSLLALYLGVAFHVQAAGREFTVSWIDLLAVGIAAAGAATAWRRRELRWDGVLWAYGALLVVIAVQAVVLPDPWAIVGGSSRFLTAGLVLFGLSQFAPGRGEMARSWPLAVLVFGLGLAVWTLSQFVRGLAAVDAVTFYEVKNAISLPIGASNYLAAFLLVAALVGVVYAATRRGWGVAAALTVLGLIGTLSRGAMAAFGVALLGGAWMARSWRLAATAGVVAVTASLVFLGVANGAATLVDAPAIEVAARAADADGAVSQPAVAAAAPDPNANGRLVLYRAAWDAFVDDPWIGVGLNRLDTVTAPTGPPHVNAHNLGLHALASVGVVGTAAYLAVWALLGWRIRRLPSGTERTALAVAAGGLFVHAQVEALAFTRGVEVLLALLLVLSGSFAGAPAMRRFTLGRVTSTAG